MAPRVRMLLLTENFPPGVGGSGRWFWEMYRRLPRGEVVIAAGELAGHGDFDDDRDLSVVRVPLTLPSWGLLARNGRAGYRRAMKALDGALKGQEVCAVHAGRCLPEGLIARVLKLTRGIPYLCYVHGEELNYAAASRELAWLTRRVLRGASLVIANSRNTSDLLAGFWGVAGTRVRVLHPGVDIARFLPGRPDPAIRSRLGWDGRRVILTAGRLQRRKGQDTLIRALPAIRRAIPEVLYAIAGDGEERAVLENLIRQEGVDGHVQLLGAVDDRDLIACYQQCDLFVLPNRQVGTDIEGFGMVLLEAQACGKPVVAGASGGTAETMRIPETGLIVPCETPDALAGVLIELLSDRDRLERMGRAAREWVVGEFDWDVVVGRARAIFEAGMPGRAGLVSVGVAEDA